MTSKAHRQKRNLLETVCVAFVILTCLRVWVGPVNAQAQRPRPTVLPDSALQRNLQLKELQRSNELLSEIRNILTSQTLKVRIEGADNTRTDNKRGR